MEVPVKKTASSQAAWALITEGVTQARLEAHRLRHYTNRIEKLVAASDKRDLLYQVAGDIILGAPKRLDALDNSLDRTALALSKMGVTFLEARLPFSDKQMVEEATDAAFGGGMSRESVADRLTNRWLRKEAGDPVMSDEAFRLFNEGLNVETGELARQPPKFSTSYITDSSKATRSVKSMGGNTYKVTGSFRLSEGVNVDDFLIAMFRKKYGNGGEGVLFKTFLAFVRDYFPKARKEIESDFEGRFSNRLPSEIFGFRDAENWENPRQVKVKGLNALTREMHGRHWSIRLPIDVQVEFVVDKLPDMKAGPFTTMSDREMEPYLRAYENDGPENYWMDGEFRGTRRQRDEQLRREWRAMSPRQQQTMMDRFNSRRW
jgi:hypothetical protein